MESGPALTPLPPSLLTWRGGGEPYPSAHLCPSPWLPPDARVRATPPAAPPTPRDLAEAPDAVFT